MPEKMWGPMDVLLGGSRAQEMIRSYLRSLAAEEEGADLVMLSERLYQFAEGAITASQLHGEP